MISVVNDAFRAEASRYGLRFTCEDCVCFDEQAQRCSHSYPTQEHRQVDLQQAQHVVFCKEFELA